MIKIFNIYKIHELENEKGHQERAKKSAKHDKDSLEKHLEKIIHEYEEKIELLVKEIDKLKEMLRIKSEEIEITIHEKLGIERELHRLGDTLKYREHEIEEARININKRNEEIEEWKHKFYDLHAKVLIKINLIDKFLIIILKKKQD